MIIDLEEDEDGVGHQGSAFTHGLDGRTEPANCHKLENEGISETIALDQLFGVCQPSERSPLNSPVAAKVERHLENMLTVLQSLSESGGAGFSRKRLPFSSLKEGLNGHPLQVLSNIIPKGFTKGASRMSPENFVDVLVHHKIEVGHNRDIVLYLISRFLVLTFLMFALGYHENNKHVLEILR